MDKILNGTITVLSPLAHGSDEKAGIDTKFRRIKMIVDGKSIRVPVLSGNTIRHRLRVIAGERYLNLLGIEKSSVEKTFFYMLFSGGLLQKGSDTAFIDIPAIREFRDKVIPLSIFGTASPSMIHEGKLGVGMAIPIVKETEKITAVITELPIWDITDEIFYTRSDPFKQIEGSGKAEEEKTEEETASEQKSQMYYTTECIVPGTILKHLFHLRGMNEFEEGCFWDALGIFYMKPFLGASSRIGHGKVEMDYELDLSSAEKYQKRIAQKKDEILEYLRGNGWIGEPVKKEKDENQENEKMRDDEWVDK